MMTRAIPALLLFTACAEEMPLDQAGIPPLQQPDLHVGNVVIGQSTVITVDDIAPGATVHIAGGNRVGNGPCPPALGLCLDVVGAREIASGVANASGVATFSVPIPRLGRDEVAFQAVVDGMLSPALSRVVQAAPPRPLVRPAQRPGFVAHTPNSLFVDGDTVFVEVSYSGGCAQHDFELAWDGTFTQAAGQAPEANLRLWHNPHGDMCQAYATETRRFDLSAIRAQWTFGEPEIATISIGRMSDDYAF